MGIKEAFWEKATLFDFLSMLIISLHGVLLLLNWESFPIGIDSPYHLLMGKMFSDFHTVCLWDYYEFAPIGRPNLYPPLEHVLIWFLHDAFNLNFLDVGRVIGIIQYPLTLFSAWLVTRLIYNEHVSALTLSLLSACPEFWMWQCSVAPTALIIALLPLFLYSFYKKNFLFSTILLTVFLYSHLGLPYVIILGLFIFCLLIYRRNKSYLGFFGKVTGLSFLLFSPWIYHILTNLDSLSAHLVRSRIPLIGFLSMNLLILVFSIAGFFFLLRKRRVKDKLFLAAFLGFFSILFTYGARYFLHSPIINSLVAAVGLVFFLKILISKMVRLSEGKKRVLFSGVILAVFMFSLFFNLKIGFAGGRRNKGQFLGPKKTSLFNLLQTPLASEFRGLKEGSLFSSEGILMIGLFHDQDLQKVIAWIKENTSENEIIHVRTGPVGDYICLMSGRRTDTGMYREVQTEEMFQALKKGKKSGVFVLGKNEFLRYKPFINFRFKVLAVYGKYVIIEAAQNITKPSIEEMKGEIEGLNILLKKGDIENNKLLNEWIKTVKYLNPPNLSIGVSQQIATSKTFLDFLMQLRKETKIEKLEVTVFVEETETIIRDIETFLSKKPQINSLRVMGPKIFSINIEEASNIVKRKGLRFGVGIIGPLLQQTRKTSGNLKRIVENSDYVVRHTALQVEFIYGLIEKDLKLLKPLKKPFYVQIDLSKSRIESPETLSQELMSFILSSGKYKEVKGFILEIPNPLIPQQTSKFLRTIIN